MASENPPLKVLQLAGSLFDWGGIERYVVYLSDGLTERGHRVHVVCPEGSPLRRKLEVPVVEASVRSKYSPSTLAAHLRILKNLKPGVVHAHFSPDFLMPAVAARLAKVPLVVMTRHVAVPWSPAKVRLNTKLFDHFIPVSNAVERVLAESGVPRNSMTVAKAGCPALQSTQERAKTRAELGIQGFCAGTFGRLVKDKGTDLAIQGAVLAGVPLVVLGDGPERESLQRASEESGGLVRLLGYREDVADCMAAVDAVLLPSRWAEAFPFAALEAMSLGRPLIAANVGGLPEMVDDWNGLIFEREDAPGLANALKKLSTDPELARRLGEQGREIHREHYTVPAMAARIEAVYRTQLKR